MGTELLKESIEVFKIQSNPKNFTKKTSQMVKEQKCSLSVQKDLEYND